MCLVCLLALFSRFTQNLFEKICSIFKFSHNYQFQILKELRKINRRETSTRTKSLRPGVLNERSQTQDLLIEINHLRQRTAVAAMNEIRIEIFPAEQEPLVVRGFRRDSQTTKGWEASV